MKINIIRDTHKVPNLPNLLEWHNITTYYIVYRHALQYKGVLEVKRTNKNTWQVMTSDGTIYEMETLKSVYNNARTIAYNEIEFINEILKMEG